MTEALDDFELIRDQARRFLLDLAQPQHLKDLLEQAGSFDQTIWAASVELGWPAVTLPEQDDGLGLGWGGLCVLAEELGRRTVSLPLIASATVAQLLLAPGLAEPAVLAALTSGAQHACLALCQSGSPELALTPRMRWSEGRLSGATAITAFAASADYALVPAQGAQGLVLLLVTLKQAGVQRRIEPVLDNSRAAASLVFEAVPALELGAGAAAETLLWQAASLAVLASAFEQIGGAQVCLDMARDYALERKAFGQQIGRFQAIKSKLADMYIRLELARGCALDALAALAAHDPNWLGLAAAARIAAIDAYEVAAKENIQTHGAIGVTWEAMPHHHYRRSRALALELGAALAWRERLLATVSFEHDAI